MFRKLIVLFSLLLTVGCATQLPPLTNQQAQSADYGLNMVNVQCWSRAEKLINNTLKDPQSAIYRHGSCKRGYLQLGNDYVFGYLLQGTVNAKNSFGGYAGATDYGFLFRNGEVVAYCWDGCTYTHNWRSM